MSRACRPSLFRFVFLALMRQGGPFETVKRWVVSNARDLQVTRLSTQLLRVLASTFESTTVEIRDGAIIVEGQLNLYGAFRAAAQDVHVA